MKSLPHIILQNTHDTLSFVTWSAGRWGCCLSLISWKKWERHAPLLFNVLAHYTFYRTFNKRWSKNLLMKRSWSQLLSQRRLSPNESRWDYCHIVMGGCRPKYKIYMTLRQYLPLYSGRLPGLRQSVNHTGIDQRCWNTRGHYVIFHFSSLAINHSFLRHCTHCWLMIYMYM